MSSTDSTTVAAVPADQAPVVDAAGANDNASTVVENKTNGEANGAHGTTESTNAAVEPNGEATAADANGEAAKEEGTSGRKVKSKKATAAAPEPSRRSTRISAQPVKDEPVKSTGRKTSVSKKNGKRGAEEIEGEGAEAEEASNKKVKAESSEGELKIGDVLPALTVKNEKDEDVEVATLAAENGVVLFCVPKADTPGCTTQACGYRDIYPDFTSSGYDVYCVSADSPTAQQKWQTKKSLPYPLLSDPSRTLITALGAADKGNKTKRSHFVFEKGGKLVDKKIPVKAADSPKIALEFIKSHSSSAGAAGAAPTDSGAADVVMADATATATAPEVAPAAAPAEAAAPVESTPIVSDVVG